MEIPVLIERVGRNGYRASGMEPFGPVPKVPLAGGVGQATRQDRKPSQERSGTGDTGDRRNPHPWMEFAGMFKDDPWIEDWKRSVEEYREQVDEDPNML